MQKLLPGSMTFHDIMILMKHWLNDPDVEAVYVATPNSLHYENCRLMS